MCRQGSSARCPAEGAGEPGAKGWVLGVGGLRVRDQPHAARARHRVPLHAAWARGASYARATHTRSHANTPPQPRLEDIRNNAPAILLFLATPILVK